VHVVLYAPHPLRVLLLRRPESRTAGWQGVTGRVEERDDTGPDTPLLLAPPATQEMPTLARACLREIAEETGLPPPLDLEDLALERAFDGHDGVHYRQRSFAARYAAPHPIPATPEHEEARWLPAPEALRLARWESDRAAITLLLARENATDATPAF
jgi:8-oxo-dGTP pyrophosphatase MutT (NUDIX family)